jgi:hypothetical protein
MKSSDQLLEGAAGGANGTIAEAGQVLFDAGRHRHQRVGEVEEEVSSFRRRFACGKYRFGTTKSETYMTAILLWG